jgi:UDP-N-acetylmuramoyl-L-alanyl-D-glutamate--2,6-diaminopimelate ligase
MMSAPRQRGVPLPALTRDIADQRPPAIEIEGLAMDSRQVRAGYAFVAVRGSRAHGLDHAREAVARGATVILTDQHAPPMAAGVPVLVVPDLRRHVSRIAGRFYGNPSETMDIVAVTGTNGKTTVSHLLAEVLEQYCGRPCGYIGTLGHGRIGAIEAGDLTTPDPIATQAMLAEFLAKGVRNVVLEASSHALDQWRLDGVIVRCGVFTNLSRDHLDYHASMAAYASAKKRLFELDGAATAVLNVDDPIGREWQAELSGRLQCWSFSADGAPARELGLRHVHVERVAERAEGSDLRIHCVYGAAPLSTAFVGLHNASNIAAVSAAALASGVTFERLLATLARARPAAGRLQRVGAFRPAVFVDYAHSPDALEKVLQVLKGLTPGRLWCVFGCGGDRDAGKRPLMGAVAERIADRIVITNDNPRSESPQAIAAQILDGMRSPQACRVELDRRAAIAFALRTARDDDVILIAGKGHERTQRIGDRTFDFSDAEVVAALQAELRR